MKAMFNQIKNFNKNKTNRNSRLEKKKEKKLIDGSWVTEGRNTIK